MHGWKSQTLLLKKKKKKNENKNVVNVNADPNTDMVIPTNYLEIYVPQPCSLVAPDSVGYRELGGSRPCNYLAKEKKN